MPFGQLPLTNLLFPAETATRVGTTTLPLDEEGVPEGGGRFALRATIAPMFYIGSSCSKIVVPFGAIPLNRLQSLRDRIPHGVIFIHASFDYCFVIASEGVIKKRAEALFFITPTRLVVLKFC